MGPRCGAPLLPRKCMRGRCSCWPFVFACVFSALCGQNGRRGPACAFQVLRRGGRPFEKRAFRHCGLGGLERLQARRCHQQWRTQGLRQPQHYRHSCGEFAAFASNWFFSQCRWVVEQSCITGKRSKNDFDSRDGASLDSRDCLWGAGFAPLCFFLPRICVLWCRSLFPF